MKAKKGQILEITTGEYDDYGVSSICIVTKNFDSELVKEFIGKTYQEVLLRLINEGYIKEYKKGVVELFLGSSYDKVDKTATLDETHHGTL